MAWIFGSFLVTTWALTGCHAVMSKQGYDSAIRAVEYNRCVTGRRSRDENHAGRFRQSAELARGCILLSVSCYIIFTWKLVALSPSWN